MASNRSLRKPSSLKSLFEQVFVPQGNTYPEILCNAFALSSIHQLRGHTVLIETSDEEESHQIEIIVKKDKVETGENGFVLILSGTLFGIILGNKTLSLSQFNSTDKSTKIIPYEKVTFFFRNYIFIVEGNRSS